MTSTISPRGQRVPHFVGGGRIEWRTRPVPQPGPGELLLRVKANAICGTDRGILSAGSPVPPGHEIAGIVADAGVDTSVAPGTQGVVYLMDFCGECRECQVGATNQCAAKRADVGFTHDGGYGQFALVHETNFFVTGDGLPAAEATLLLDVMGTAAHALDRGLALRGEIGSLLIAGAGPVGLGCVAMARLLLGAGMPVLIADVVPYRLALAERLGATPLDVRHTAITEALASADIHFGADMAIDTAGRGESRRMLLGALGRRGVLVCVGHGEGLQLDVSADLIAPERSVLGSEYFPYAHLAPNLRLLQAHRDYLRQILTHRFPVERIADAYDAFLGGETGKVVVEQ